MLLALLLILGLSSMSNAYPSSCPQRAAPECSGSQVLKVATDSRGCQQFSCGCDRQCPALLDPICDERQTLHDNWCKFGIAACELEFSLRVLKMAPLLSCKGMSPGPFHCFHFGEDSPQAHVVLHPLTEQAITDFTIDFSMKITKMTPEPFFVSYAVPGSDNELLLGLGASQWYAHNSVAGYPKQRVSVNVYHRVTFTLKDTRIRVYLDGVLITEKKVRPRALTSGGTWVLGQDQDAVGGEFDVEQRLIGKICNFRMWNFGMDEQEIPSFFDNPSLSQARTIFDNPPTYRYEKMNGAY